MQTENQNAIFRTLSYIMYDTSERYPEIIARRRIEANKSRGRSRTTWTYSIKKWTRTRKYAEAVKLQDKNRSYGLLWRIGSSNPRPARGPNINQIEWRVSEG